MADIYGQLISAQLETLNADPTGVTGRVYYNTTSNVFKFYHAGASAWRTLADTTTAITDVTTTRGDLIRRGAAALERFAAVTDNRVVRGDGTDVILGQIDDPDFFTTGAAAGAAAIGIVTTAGQTFAGLKQFNDGITAPTTAAGNVYSGGKLNITDAGTGSDLLASRASTTVSNGGLHYSRLGNMVMCWGYFETTGGAGSDLYLELPVTPTAFSASSAGARQECNGSYHQDGGTIKAVYGEPSGTRALFVNPGGGGNGAYFFFAYRL